MSGSALVVVADTREEVLELLKGDVYAKSGVWDVEGVVLYPVSSFLFFLCLLVWS